MADCSGVGAPYHDQRRRSYVASRWFVEIDQRSLMFTVRGQKVTSKIFVCKSHHREKNVWHASSDTSNFVDLGAAQGCAAAVDV